MCLQRSFVRLPVCTLRVLEKTEGRGEERSHFISNRTSFPENIYLIVFSFQVKLTSLIAPKTSWKINSRVFEIPEWIRWGYLAWARVYLFSNCRLDQGCVDSEGIWFAFCYRRREGALTANRQRWDESEAAVCSRFIRKNKIFSSLCHIVCSNICCCGVVSIAFYSYFPQTPVQQLHLYLQHSWLRQCNLFCVAWGAGGLKWLRNPYHSWMSWLSWTDIKENIMFFRITTKEKENSVADASVLTSMF